MKTLDSDWVLGFAIVIDNSHKNQPFKTECF